MMIFWKNIALRWIYKMYMFSLFFNQIILHYYEKFINFINFLNIRTTKFCTSHYNYQFVRRKHNKTRITKPSMQFVKFSRAFSFVVFPLMKYYWNRMTCYQRRREQFPELLITRYTIMFVKLWNYCKYRISLNIGFMDVHNGEQPFERKHTCVMLIHCYYYLIKMRDRFRWNDRRKICVNLVTIQIPYR